MRIAHNPEPPFRDTSMPFGNKEEIPSRDTFMPFGNKEEIPSRDTSMPFGNKEEIPSRVDDCHIAIIRKWLLAAVFWRKCVQLRIFFIKTH